MIQPKHIKYALGKQVEHYRAYGQQPFAELGGDMSKQLDNVRPMGDWCLIEFGRYQGHLPYESMAFVDHRSYMPGDRASTGRPYWLGSHIILGPILHMETGL